MLNEEQKKALLENAGFKCEKCSYYSPLGKGLEINRAYKKVLCSICNTFAPLEAGDFSKYAEEKIEWQNLETFRNSGVNRLSHSSQKQGMLAASKNGRLMARPAFGYKVIGGELIIDDENSQNVKLIFDEFLNGQSLNQLSKIYGISVNGIKKILRNFTYIGKIKFAGQIVNGKHKPIISAEIFNRAQAKFDSKKKE